MALNPTEWLVILYVILAVIQSIRFRGKIVANLIRSIALVILGALFIGIATAPPVPSTGDYALEGVGVLLFLVSYILLFFEIKPFRRGEA